MSTGEKPPEGAIRPDPVFTPDAAFFWEGAARGQLLGQRCADCARLRHPPRPMCPSCRSTERQWRAIAGTGTIWSMAVPHPPLLEPYSSLAPYNVVVVELDADSRIRFVGNLVTEVDASLDSVDPSTIRIGEPVEVVFKPFTRKDGSSESLPFWVRRSA